MQVDTNVNDNDVRQLRNEVVWANLIMLSNNKLVMDNLNAVTKNSFINLLCSYVETNIATIQKYDTIKSEAILRHLKK